ncbi:MAG: hypothetical protein LBS74_11140 [Oscillospiraceae bacterium]|jgi:hypothetical protein|nr:hypothetical protein [Oscillospiraceae bacterium]
MVILKVSEKSLPKNCYKCKFYVPGCHSKLESLKPVPICKACSFQKEGRRIKDLTKRPSFCPLVELAD